MTVTGWPVGTVVRGERVMWEGALLTPAAGQAVQFVEVLAQSDSEAWKQPFQWGDARNLPE